MGQYDIFVIGGVAVAAGYVLLTNPDILTGILGGHGDPIVDGGEEEAPVVEGNEETSVVDGGPDGDTKANGNGNGGDGDSGAYDCKKACKNCWCKSYSEKCSGSCSKCCGSSRIASKCEGKGVKSCGGGGSGGSGGGGGDGIYVAGVAGVQDLARISLA